MRSRYEVANNSYAKGLVQMLANDTVGTGPRLQMLTEDEDFNDKIEKQFVHWADAVGLAWKLRCMRIARCQDGESFAVLATNPKVRHPVKLQIGFMKRAKKEQLDELLATVEKLGMSFSGKEFCGAKCIAVGFNPIYAADQLRERNQFTSVIELTFRDTCKRQEE